jgi:hypothetical protein
VAFSSTRHLLPASRGSGAALCMLLRVAGIVSLDVALPVGTVWAIVARTAVHNRYCWARACAGVSIGTFQLMHEGSARKAVAGWLAFGGQHKPTWWTAAEDKSYLIESNWRSC